jgi:hypothetical protein
LERTKIWSRALQGPETKTDHAGGDQQINSNLSHLLTKSIWMELHGSQSHKRVKYGHQSSVTKNDCLMSAAIYPTNWPSHSEAESHDSQSWEKNLVVIPVGPRTMKDCAAEGK